MDTLTKDELRELNEQPNGLCLSFHVPTEKAGSATLENPQRLHGLQREARSRLDAAGVPHREVEDLLGPVTELRNDYSFWQHQDRGLAIFVSRGLFRRYRIPYPVAAECIVGRGCHVKPLLPLLTDGGEFYILALSKNAVTLYRSNRFSIEEVHLDSLPLSEADALQYENPEKSLQMHTGQPVGRGEQAAIVHGQGANKDAAKDRTVRFLRRVDAGLHEHLRGRQAPLILAGVEQHRSLYHDVNTYPHLFDGIIPGNPEHSTADELREAAWQRLEPTFRKPREQAAAAIDAGLSKGAASNDLEASVAAACHGRAAKTFVPLDTQRWGAWDARNASVTPLSRDDVAGCDLLDLAAVQTVLQGADAYPVHTVQDVPGQGEIAVLYRF